MMNAEQLMTTEVFTVSPTMTVREAMKVLVDHRVAGAPVVDTQKRVLTVISEGDLLRLTAAFGMDVTVNSCMAKLCKPEALVSCKRTDSFKDVYRLFLGKSIHRIPVMDGNGKLQGIISRSNVIRALLVVSKPETKAVS